MLHAERPRDDQTFAANRARGRIALSVTADGGASRRARVHEAGSLRVRFPNGTDAARLEAVLVNTAGGMTGGDRFGIDIEVGRAAQLTLTTAAAEKVYRSLGPDAAVDVTLKLASRAALAWLPQETILFDRARLARSIDIELAEGADLVLAEGIVFGRAAMGETVQRGRLSDRWRLRVGGALVLADTVSIEGAVARQMMERAVAAGGCAMASVLKVPGDEHAVAAARALAESFCGEAGISSWNGLVLARLIASDGAALRRDLISLLTTWSGAPVPRLWLN